MKKKLYISGGGLRGIAYLDIFKKFEEDGTLANVESISGTSVGSIFAGLLGFGFTNAEINEVLVGSNLRDIFEDPAHKVLGNLLFGGSVHSGDAFETMFNMIVTKKLIMFPLSKTYKNFTQEQKNTYSKLFDKGADEITYADLHTLAQLPNSPFKDITTVAYNMTDQTTEEFNYENTPHITIKDGIRASLSIQGYFKPKLIDGKYYSDGGVTANQPYLIAKKDPTAIVLDLPWAASPHAAGKVTADGKLAHQKVHKLNLLQYYHLAIEAIAFSTQRSIYQDSNVVTVDSGELEHLEFGAKKQKLSQVANAAASIFHLPTKVTNRTEDTTKSLVFSGGHKTMPAMLGVALAYKEQNQIPAKIGGHGNASIIATMIALDMNAVDIQTNFTKYEKMQNYFELTFSRSVNLSKGMHSGKERKQYIKDMLGDNKEKTLGDYPNLHLSVFNLATQSMEILSSKTHPGLKIADALFIATNTILLNRPVYFKDGKIQDKETEGCTIYVSADICKTSPAAMFDTETTYCPNTKGFYVQDKSREKLKITKKPSLIEVVKNAIDANLYGTEQVLCERDKRVTAIAPKTTKEDYFSSAFEAAGGTSKQDFKFTTYKSDLEKFAEDIAKFIKDILEIPSKIVENWKAKSPTPAPSK